MLIAENPREVPVACVGEICREYLNDRYAFRGEYHIGQPGSMDSYDEFGSLKERNGFIE